MADNQPAPAGMSSLRKLRRADLTPGLNIVIVDQEQGIVAHATVKAPPAPCEAGGIRRLTVRVKFEAGEETSLYLDYMGVAPYEHKGGVWSKTVFTIHREDLPHLPQPLPILNRKGLPSVLPAIHWT